MTPCQTFPFCRLVKTAFSTREIKCLSIDQPSAEFHEQQLAPTALLVPIYLAPASGGCISPSLAKTYDLCILIVWSYEGQKPMHAELQCMGHSFWPSRVK